MKKYLMGYAGVLIATLMIASCSIEENIHEILPEDETALPEGEEAVVTLKASVEKTKTDFETPIVWGAPCELNLTGCILNGTDQGLVARIGTVTVNNSTITNAPTGAFSAPATWGKGNSVPNSALVLGNNNSSYYQFALNFSITGNSAVEANATNSTYAPDFYATYIASNTGTGLGTTFSYAATATVTTNYGKTGPATNTRPGHQTRPAANLSPALRHAPIRLLTMPLQPAMPRPPART